MAEFQVFFESEYYPKCRDDAGCSSLPNGSEIYDLCLKYHTTTSLKPEEIHKIGLSEVANIENRYKNDVLGPLGFDVNDLSGFIDMIQKNPKFHVQTEDALINAYKEKCKVISTILPEYFTEFPKSPLEIQGKGFGPSAFYLAGTADGKRPGRFYINTNHINEKPLYEVTSLSLHEAIPGHHHQVALFLENETIPMVINSFNVIVVL